MTPNYLNNAKMKEKNRFSGRNSNSSSYDKDLIVGLVYIQEDKDICSAALADGSSAEINNKN